MSEGTAKAALEALLKRRNRIAGALPAVLVEGIYRIEERVQFDGQRPEAAARIRELVQAHVEKVSLEGPEVADKA